MRFRDAVDAVCLRVTHADVAEALGVSLSGLNKALVDPHSGPRCADPVRWYPPLAALARARTMHYARLYESLSGRRLDL